MRKLSIEKRTQILTCLTEGYSIRATTRMCNVSKLTVLRLLTDVGSLCANLHEKFVRNLPSVRVQIDEIWSFVGCKQDNKRYGKQGDGDCWTFCAIDANSKLVISYLVGLRDLDYAIAFVKDIAKRVKNRIQLTSDGYRPYLSATIKVFGFDGVDFAQLIKIYGKDTDRRADAKYSPSKCVGTLERIMLGDPNEKHISTSFAERINLTTRMSNRRFTRLTNAFSKKWRNHEHSISLHYFYYNFCRKHMTLGMTPAMAAGITDQPWTIHDIVELLVEKEKKNAYHGRINKKDRK